MLSETFENVQNWEIKSESGFRVAMASQPLEEILMLGWLSRLSFWWLCWEASTSPVSSAHVYRAADTFNPLMSLVKKMPKPQLNTNSEIFWESYLPGKCNVRCSCKIYRKCPLSLHVGWVFQSMDEDENLRVHAEVCRVPISADRGVGSLSGYS